MINEAYGIINIIAKKVSEHGGNAFLVGGCVRDKIMGIDSKDFDIEVHKLSPDILRSVLDSVAPYSEVGRSFGIFALHGYPIDIALPRCDTKKGTGHRDFDITIDPFMGEYNAGKRRDFTMNSLMQNILTGEIIDNFGGISDIKNKIIRHTNNDTFAQDPLRVLRAAQFASRFNFKICEDTLFWSRKVNLSTLSKERVFEETRKALLSSVNPSIYFECLRNMNQLSAWFEEIQFTDVKWKKAMESLDTAAIYKSYTNNPMAFMLCVLSCHIENAENRISFIKRLTSDKSIINYVKNMSAIFSYVYDCAMEKKDEFFTNKMFDDSIDKEGLIFLIKAVANIDEKEELFLKERLLTYQELMKTPPLSGKDLIQAGFHPGEDFSKILNEAHKLHLMGISKDDILLKLKGIFTC